MRLGQAGIINIFFFRMLFSSDGIYSLFHFQEMIVRVFIGVFHYDVFTTLCLTRHAPSQLLRLQSFAAF